MLILQRLQSIRKARGLSQAAVASQLNISREALSMYETGHRQPSNELLRAIARFYNVSMDYLLGLSDVPDSFADLSGKALFISRSASRMDPGELDDLLQYTEKLLSMQSRPRRGSRAAEHPVTYGGEDHSSGSDETPAGDPADDADDPAET